LKDCNLFRNSPDAIFRVARIQRARVSKKVSRKKVSKEEDKMAWLYLFLAGLLEVGWALGLKYTDGFTKLAPSLLTVAAMVGSFVLLGQALRVLPIGTAYAIWTGIGAVGTAILGMMIFGEPRDLARVLCILLIVAGIVGLKFTTASS
jgi:quaternary ammonium compound-resistance protein SugE